MGEHGDLGPSQGGQSQTLIRTIPPQHPCGSKPTVAAKHPSHPPSEGTNRRARCVSTSFVLPGQRCVTTGDWRVHSRFSLVGGFSSVHTLPIILINQRFLPLFSYMLDLTFPFDFRFYWCFKFLDSFDRLSVYSFHALVCR